MVIYLWKVGERPGVRWAFSWGGPKPEHAKAVDLDRWFEYDLNEEEVLACLEAVEKAEEMIND